MDRYIRHIHTFSLTKLSTVDNLTDQFFFFLLDYFQSDQSVIDQDCLSLAHIIDQSRIRNRYDVLISCHLFCRKRKFLSGLQHDLLSVLQQSGTDLRSFGIQQDRNIGMLLLTKLLQKIHTAFLLCMISVGKIETCHIHSIPDQLSHQFFIIRIGSHRTYYFRLFHRNSLSFS